MFFYDIILKNIFDAVLRFGFYYYIKLLLYKIYHLDSLIPRNSQPLMGKASSGPQ